LSYYLILGLELCKQRIVESDHPDFLPCKGPIDAMYRCYTENQYGDEYQTTTKEALPHAMRFFNCYFYKHSSLTNCMIHFEDSVRAIYRTEGTKLTDYC